MGITREEFSLLVKGMKSVYSYPNFIADKEAFDMWYALLSDIDYPVLAKATKDYMMTESKLPTPADIRNRVMKSYTATELSDSEAWALVSNALRNSAYHAEEEYEKLPELVKRAVGSPSILHEMGTAENYNESVESSNFKRTYRTLLDRSHEELKVNLVELINNGQPRIEENGKYLWMQ